MGSKIFIKSECIIFCFYFVSVLSHASSITTIHHDKPAEASLAEMAQKMKNAETLKNLNVTLPASERHKRLLPYMTFYLAQDFNRPFLGAQKYALPQKPHYETSNVPKYYNYRPNIDPQQILLQPKTKFTPFLESNALPGPFVPMTRHYPQTIKAGNQLQIKPSEISKLPNYSAIYDKLSQLKLLQHNTRYSNPEYTPQSYAYKPQYIPDFQYKPEHNTKTIIQTYTPTNIEIPSDQYTAEKPPPSTYIHEQYTLGPAIPIRNQEYLSDQKQYYREEIRKPALFYRQKIQPQKEPLLLQPPITNLKQTAIFVQKQHPILNYKPIYLKHPQINQPQKLLYHQDPPNEIIIEPTPQIIYQTEKAPTYQQVETSIIYNNKINFVL